jgi:hypothetical protein
VEKGYDTSPEFFYPYHINAVERISVHNRAFHCV